MWRTQNRWLGLFYLARCLDAGMGDAVMPTGKPIIFAHTSPTPKAQA
jgi:hypothetical protein